MGVTGKEWRCGRWLLTLWGNVVAVHEQQQLLRQGTEQLYDLLLYALFRTTGVVMEGLLWSGRRVVYLVALCSNQYGAGWSQSSLQIGDLKALRVHVWHVEL